MTKSEKVIGALQYKYSSFRFEQLRSVPFNVISTKEGYVFRNHSKDMLLPMISFNGRAGNSYPENSRKSVSDMIIDGLYATNIVGFSEYYGDDTGDIFCENGCVYSKKGALYMLSLFEESTDKSIIVVNAANVKFDLIKCFIKAYIETSPRFNMSLIIGSPLDYIKVR